MTTPTDAETVCRFGMPLPHPAPVLPCWYCNGKTSEGEAYDPKVHHGWACEACDERRALLDGKAAAERATRERDEWERLTKGLLADRDERIEREVTLRTSLTRAEAALRELTEAVEEYADRNPHGDGSGPSWKRTVLAAINARAALPAQPKEGEE